MSSQGVSTRAANKVAFISLAGTSIEWYDFFLYGTAATLVFPKLFFPPDLPPLIAQISSFGTFAVGFLSRPLGGVLFGHFGDKVGRKKALVLALILMGAATTLIGLLPSFASVGVLAPILLVALRLAQGLALGGQWGGAVLLAVEAAPPHRRGFYGSFAQAGVPFGVILANIIFLAVSTNLSDVDFFAWGWRLPFLFSVVLVGIALYVQLYIEDTPAFKQLAAAKAARDAEAARVGAAPQKLPVFKALARYPKEIALASGAMMAVSMAFYIMITFAVAYGVNLHISRNVMLIAVLIGAFLMAPVVFISAALSDRWGRRGIYLGGAVLLGAWSFAMFPLIATGDAVLVAIAVSVGLVVVGAMYGPQAAFFSEMFSTDVRYSGCSLGYQIGTVLGGAIAPLLATALLQQFGTTLAISIYMGAVCLITALSVFALKESFKHDLDTI